ncbi:MAG: hypothetical protein DMG96_41070 [Acidobacteria bacterium]|nr:MAG: hypothetical protein DMG96_41070 [Acidobacteriota bacterium]
MPVVLLLLSMAISALAASAFSSTGLSGSAVFGSGKRRIGFLAIRSSFTASSKIDLSSMRIFFMVQYPQRPLSPAK